MPEVFRALLAVLAVSLPLLYLARQPACRAGMAPADFTRRSTVWLMLTLAAFIAHHVWIYMTLAGVLLWVARRHEANPLALYLFLLLAVPPIGAEIGALGFAKFFFEIDHTRLLALLVLLPALLTTDRRLIGAAAAADEDGPAEARAEIAATTVPHIAPKVAPFGSLATDWCLAAYVGLLFVIQLTADSVTDTLRVTFYNVIGIFLPYYAASRLIQDISDFREALLAFVIAALPVAAVALAEFAMHWLLYAALPAAWGIDSPLGRYLGRGDALRALASTGHPIVLGYVMTVAIGLAVFLRQSRPMAAWYPAILLLLGGLLASLSRGPWVGCLAMLAVLVLTDRHPWQRIAVPAGLLALALPVLSAMPVVGSVLDYLPFIGSIDAENVSYRQRLLDISLDVIADHPWLGNYHFLDDLRMQTLTQGQQIVDLVNSYLAIALHGGVLGLALFVGFFLTILAGIFREMRRLDAREGELYLLGRVLLATLSGILVIIFTTSSIGVIGLIYWTVAGLGAAYIRMLAAQRRAASSLTDRSPSPWDTGFP